MNKTATKKYNDWKKGCDDTANYFNNHYKITIEQDKNDDNKIYVTYGLIDMLLEKYNIDEKYFIKHLKDNKPFEPAYKVDIIQNGGIIFILQRIDLICMDEKIKNFIQMVLTEIIVMNQYDKIKKQVLKNAFDNLDEETFLYLFKKALKQSIKQ